MNGCSTQWLDVLAFDAIDALSDGIKFCFPAAFLFSWATTEAYSSQKKYKV
jgi:hypothetical protein